MAIIWFHLYGFIYIKLLNSLLMCRRAKLPFFASRSKKVSKKSSSCGTFKRETEVKKMHIRT